MVRQRQRCFYASSHGEDLRSMDDSTDSTGTTGPVGAALTSKEGYATALKAFDAAICEAVAVSQGIAGRMVAPHVGYAARVFTRICGHGIALIRAAPRSR